MHRNLVRLTGLLLAFVMGACIVAIYSQPEAYKAGEMWGTLAIVSFLGVLIGGALAITGRMS